MSSEERTHRSAPESVPSLTRKVRSFLGLSQDRPLYHPRTPRIEPIRRSWVAAFWHARISVRAGVPLDDFLRSRLARYLATLPVPRGRLPVAIEVEDGQLAVRQAEPERGAAPAAAAADAWMQPLVALEGPAARQEISDLEVRLAVLEGDIDAARKRREELSRRFAADVAAGMVVAPPGIEATAEQLGRPPVRSAAPHAAMVAFAAAALVAETWQVALPLLRAAGVDVLALGAELSRKPADVGFASVFALGVAAGLFALSDAALGAAARLFAGDDDGRRRRWLAGALGASAGVSVLVASALAAMRVAPAAADEPPWTFVLLLLAVPLATALLVRVARREAERRATEMAAALAWDRERARALADRARRLEELDWADDELRELEDEREAARRRLKDVNARAIEAARMASDAAAHERVALARLGQSVVAALELDRYEFVRQAASRGASELLAPRRRKLAGEARAPFSDSSVSVPVSAAEAGRLAS